MGPAGRRPAGRGATAARACASRPLAGLLAGALVALLAGCNDGVRWQGPTYQDAQAQARRTDQLTFVYFRSWYLVECTDFEEKVLKSPDVLAATRELVCVALDFDWDRPLAQRWQLQVVPAFAIVAPNGTILARQQAPITRADVLNAIQLARQVFVPGSGGQALSP